MNNKKKGIKIAGQIFHIELAHIVFALLFIYIIVTLFNYFNKDKISIYEVVSGESAQATNKSYTGLIIRDEHVFFAENSGHINYFARDNSRVSKNTVLYSLDETGDVTKALAQSATEGDSSLSDDDYVEIKNQITSFSTTFSEKSFDDVYNFKSSIDGMVLQLINKNTIDSVSQDENSFFKIYKPEMSGIVSYYIDDFEDFDETKIEESSFDQSLHTKATFTSGDLIESGSPVYTITGDEEWNIYIQLTDDEAKEYEDTNGVSIKILKDKIDANANFEIITGADNKKYGKLTLFKYLIRYASERYLDIKINMDTTSGLKIPKTSVVEKDFYVVPVDCGKPGLNNSNTICFLIDNPDSSTGVETIEPQIFYKDEEYYYLETDAFNGNEVFIYDDSDERYTLGKKIPLTGVYNVNNGFTEFVQIHILSETNEYYIVESQKNYGLSEYDHIVLNSSTVKEKQIIFK